MVRLDGYVKVLDFGLARQLASPDQSQSMNASGILAGTLNYMAPERTRGEPATGANDVFSLGVVLYELATGKHPFRCDSPVDTAHAIVHAEPKPPSALNRNIPPALNSLLLAMLAKNPLERPLSDEVNRRLSAIERASVEQRSHRFPWLAAALIACVIGGSLVWLFQERNPSPKEPEMIQLTRQTSENRVTAAALSPDGKTLAFAPFGGSVHLLRLSDGLHRAAQNPRRLASGADCVGFIDASRLLVSGELPGQGSGIWAMALHGGKPVLITPHGRDGVPSPDGTRIAFTSLDGASISVMAFSGPARRIRVGGDNVSFSSLIWSADGRRIAYRLQESTPSDRQAGADSAPLVKNYQFSYESVDVASSRLIASVRDIIMTSACALPDGLVLFTVDLPILSHGFQIWELRTDPDSGRVLDRPRSVTHGEDLMLSSISASRDGKQIAVVRLDHQANIHIADSLPGSHVPKLLNIRRLTFSEASDYPHAWTADDQVIFESNRNGNYQLFRLPIGQSEAAPLVTTPGASVLAQLSPDQKWVLYRSEHANRERLLMRVPVDGGKPQSVPIQGRLDEFRCALQPGSRCVLRSTENDQFVFHELDPVRGEGRELARTAWSPSIIGDWDVSPDGLQVAIPIHDPHEAKIRLVPLAGGLPEAEEKTITLKRRKSLNGLNWSADGRGWYVAFLAGAGSVLSFADRGGETRDLLESAEGALYAVPSPDGRHIAFPLDIASSNAWLFRGF